MMLIVLCMGVVLVICVMLLVGCGLVFVCLCM